MIPGACSEFVLPSEFSLNNVSTMLDTSGGCWICWNNNIPIYRFFHHHHQHICLDCLPPRPFCFVMAQRKPFVALHVTLMSVLGYLGMQMTMLADDSTAVDEVYWGSEWWWWWWWGWWEMALNVDAKNPLNFIWNWIFVFIPMELEWNGMVHSFFLKSITLQIHKSLCFWIGALWRNVILPLCWLYKDLFTFLEFLSSTVMRWKWIMTQVAKRMLIQIYEI